MRPIIAGVVLARTVVGAEARRDTQVHVVGTRGEPHGRTGPQVAEVVLRDPETPATWFLPIRRKIHLLPVPVIGAECLRSLSQYLAGIVGRGRGQVEAGRVVSLGDDIRDNVEIATCKGRRAREAVVGAVGARGPLRDVVR